MRSNAGLTLTELIVSTAIVGIVMLGVVGADYAVRYTEKSGRDVALTEMRMARMMRHVMSNAYLAIGTSANPGIVIGSLGNNNSNYVCFRHDDNEDMLISAGNVDQWRCYSRRTNNFVFCTRNTANSCPGGATVIGQVTDTMYADNPPSFIMDDDVNVQKIEFNFTLATRPDPAAADDPMTNPTRVLTSSVTPYLHRF